MVATVDNTDLMMSPANRHLAKVLRGVMGWSYLVLLLLLLLYLAYKLYRWIQEESRKREIARLKQMAQETVLDSDESIR